MTTLRSPRLALHPAGKRRGVQNLLKWAPNYLIAGSLLLTACAQAPQRNEPAQPPEPQAEAAPVLPNVELSDELLYEFLLTEIANQRGHKALAVEGSADIARKTRDPRLAKRAAQLAFESGDMNKSIEAFRQWREVEPASPLAGQMLASILLRGGRLDEAQPELAKVLETEKANPGGGFMQIFQLVAPYPDKPAALKLMRNLAQPYPQVAEAHWSVAQLAQQAGDSPLALSEVRQARSLRPEWDMAASLEAQLLQKNAPQQALEVLRRYLSDYPDAREIRLQYARTLLEQKQYKLSRAEFQRLAKDNPDNPDLAFAIALISLQLNDLQDAEAQLRQALIKGKKDQDTVQHYLGQLSEAKENEDEAIAHYREVKGGEHQFAARLRVAYLLSKRGKLDEAREYLQQTQAANNQQRVQLVLIEAQLLREAKRLDDAYQVLQQGLAKLPNHPDLLYETAMLADKTGKPDIFEQLIRKLIQIKPDHAHAYNALGYSLLERNERIPEAVELVEKALQLAPDDAAIMDSVGWGYYRSGRLDESLKLLRRAFAGNPDPEVAAHLGEVLWMHGDKEEARKTWQDSLKTNPGNTLLQTVIKKFIP
ncbi:MAG TPA: tetratricopeptide repeat protein [Gallionella sp.]|nr:tetratricopeptide repeat protein [Gallionella sp.]